MWCLALTQSKHSGPNQRSLGSVEGSSLLPYQRCHFKRNEKWSQSLPKRSSQSHGCKKRSTETRQMHLYTGPMAKRRSIPSVSGSDRMDGDVCLVPRLHLPRLTSATVHPTDNEYDIATLSTWEALIPTNKQDDCVNDLVKNHKHKLFAAFCKLKAKEYLTFQ